MSDIITLDALRRSFDDTEGVTVLPPLHPGEVLREEFMVPLGLTAGAVAKALNLPRSRIERIVKEEIGISTDTALRLAGTSAPRTCSGSTSRPGSRARRCCPRSAPSLRASSPFPRPREAPQAATRVSRTCPGFGFVPPLQGPIPLRGRCPASVPHLSQVT